MVESHAHYKTENWQYLNVITSTFNHLTCGIQIKNLFKLYKIAGQQKLLRMLRDSLVRRGYWKYEQVTIRLRYASLALDWIEA